MLVSPKIVEISGTEALVDVIQLQDPGLSRSQARASLAEQRGVDPESVRRAERRARPSGVGSLGALVAEAATCECAHVHCIGCTFPGMPNMPCGLLYPVDAPWGRPPPCRPSTRSCTCNHRHCQNCGVGAPCEMEYFLRWRFSGGWAKPDVPPMLANWGTLCEPCWVNLWAEFTADVPPEEDDRPAHASWPRGCPRCSCHVREEGGVFHCIGLDAAGLSFRMAVDAYYERGTNLMPTRTKRPRLKDIKALEVTGRQVYEKHNLPPPSPLLPCGWSGPADLCGVQFWRMLRRGRGRPRKRA